MLLERELPSTQKPMPKMIQDLQNYYANTPKNWNRKTMDRYSCIGHSSSEGYILMPNEIFKDLQKSITNKRTIHFAYSFYYLITYLYQYSKYGKHMNLNRDFLFEFLQHSSNSSNALLTNLVKQGGILDSVNYTLSTTNYPINSEVIDGKLSFLYVKDFKKESGLATKLNTGSLTVKVPIKSLHRTRQAQMKRVFNGTFYNPENTHSINIKTFIDIINDNDLSTKGFYLYGGLKYMSFGKNSVVSSYEQLENILCISGEYIRKYTKILEDKGFIFVNRESHSNSVVNKKNQYILL